MIKQIDKATPKIVESIKVITKELDKSSTKLADALDPDDDCDGIDNDCDGVEVDGKGELKANHNTTRSNKTKPMNGDGDIDEDAEVKAAYILCPDGTMIQPGEKCPEKDEAVLAHELTHVVQQISADIDVENDTEVVVEENDGVRTVAVTGVESRAVFGIFPVKMDVQVKLDASGELVSVKRPWYSFLSW